MLLPLNAAYKFVAIAFMLSEVNNFTDNVGLNGNSPISLSDVVTGSHVGPVNSTNFSGSILTEKYFFGFWKGHLANYYKRGFMPDSNEGIQRRNIELSRLSSLVDSNGAFQLATNWISQIGLNLPLLESKYARSIIQWKYYHQGSNTTPVLLPVYQIEWTGVLEQVKSKRIRPIVAVTVFGARKELVEYHVLDDALFLRPRIEIRNVEKLLSIEDRSFQVFSLLEKSNLLSEFVVDQTPGI